MTQTIDQWSAEQCGVTLYIGRRVYDHEPYWFDNIRDYNFEWTIKDPRCREIVREHFELSTWKSEDTWSCLYGEYISDIHEFGKTIAEAECNCITAIYEASQ